jgi:lysophospholipase L1-like esterase
MNTRLIGAVALIAIAFGGGMTARPYLAAPFKEHSQAVSVRVSQQEGLTAPVDLVMFGDSLTDQGRWDELLGLKVANRGVGGDTVKMAAQRVHTLPPGPVYIMLGINDLNWLQRPHDRVLADYDALLASLKGRKIVVQSVLGPEGLGLPEFNASLKALAERHGADFLDLTPQLGYPLKPTYDGIHLTGDGYRLWAKQISGSLL